MTGRVLMLLLLLPVAGCASWIPGFASEPPAPVPPPEIAVDVYRGSLPSSLAQDAPAGPAVSGVPSAGAPPPVRFEVYVADRLDQVDDSQWVASGIAGGDTVAIIPGFVTIVVELSPRERVGPFELKPGASARVRLLDFPGAQVHTRTWRVERAGEPVGRAFPPPNRLEWVDEIRR